MEVLRKSARTGEPALRPLEDDFRDQGYEGTRDQFLLCENLLVAPIVTTNDSRVSAVRLK